MIPHFVVVRARRRRLPRATTRCSWSRASACASAGCAPSTTCRSTVRPRHRSSASSAPTAPASRRCSTPSPGSSPTVAGRVYLDGDALHDLAPHARAAAGLGRTFQPVGLAKDLSVRENILLAQHRAAAYGDHRAAARSPGRPIDGRGAARAAHRRASSPASGSPTAPPRPSRELSGGQQRLVELAAVLATGPELLMLDEPTAGLSPAAAENLADRLRELRDDHGQTILLIEHNVPLVLDLCDHVYVLNAGTLLADGTPASWPGTPRSWAPTSARSCCDACFHCTGIEAGFGANIVLHGVDLAVEEGSSVGLFGLNGAGKSVTMKVIAGLVPARAGTVTLARPRRHVAVARGPGPAGHGLRAAGPPAVPEADRRAEPAARRLRAAPPRQGAVRRRWSTACTSASRSCTSGAASTPGRCPAASRRCSPSAAPWPAIPRCC